MKLRTRAIMSVALVGAAAAPLGAQVFEDGIPSGYSCAGNCGTSGADGVMTLAPGGGRAFGWISTADAPEQNPLGIDGTTNGTTLTSTTFTATTGQELSFAFSYVTSDGADYTDYAFVRLLGGADPVVLFSARTTPTPGENTVPGFGLPGVSPGVTLTPSTTPINAGAPSFTPLGAGDGECFDVGCGFTDWIFAQFVIPAAGSYQLQFGVFNIDDESYNSALAFDFDTGTGGVPVVPDPSVVPEPATLALTGSGLLALAGIVRRRRRV